MGLSLEGKSCIDVGCRSWENTIAMERSGARVIGIDPVDNEFPKAKANEMKDDQFIKATLQDYRSNFLD